MTVFSCSIKPSDYHDNRFHFPPSSTIQYHIPPSSTLTSPHIRQYALDLSKIQSVADSTIFSFQVSNFTFYKYASSKPLTSDLDILFEKCKIDRVNFDFTQFRFGKGIMERINKSINHIQKHCQYNVHLSITLPVSESWRIDKNFLKILSNLMNEQLVNISMINILVTKNMKRKNISWLQMIKIIFDRVSKQLKKYANNFVGDLNQYIGFILDSDVLFENKNLLQTSFLKHHSEAKKNLTEDDFIQIWKYANLNKIGHLQLSSYLANSKSIKKVVEIYNKELNNKEFLPLPQDLMYKLTNQSVHTKLEAINSSDSDFNSDAEPPENELPDYETAMLDKIKEHELFINCLLKLPSYRTVDIVH